MLDTQYPVMEAFYTLQGEGFYSGHAAYFIRLGGCDVGCVWCDVKDSWDAEVHPHMTTKQIVDDVSRYPKGIVVITGGEPCMYDLGPLCDALHQAGFDVNIETAGVYPLKGDIDWICFSPKKFKKPLDVYFEKADELKIIIFNKSDFQWAEALAQQTNENCLLYLQPEWDKKERLLPFITAYIMSNPKWRLSLQTHKYINIP